MKLTACQLQLGGKGKRVGGVCRTCRMVRIRSGSGGGGDGDGDGRPAGKQTIRQPATMQASSESACCSKQGQQQGHELAAKQQCGQTSLPDTASQEHCEQPWMLLQGEQKAGRRQINGCGRCHAAGWKGSLLPSPAQQPCKWTQGIDRARTAEATRCAGLHRASSLAPDPRSLRVIEPCSLL